ncbi:MAG TPA: hypothetical protein VF058_08625 [Actinomycetota bacterium]
MSDRETDAAGATALEEQRRALEEQRRALDDAPWSYRGPRLHALGFDFGIRANDGEVGAYLGGLFEAFEADGEPDHVYSFIARPEEEMRYSLYFDGEHVVSSREAGGALRYFQWDVNERVIARNRGYILIHAASAADETGRGIVMPAAMDSGKTTLVSGLVRAGLRYLSDEAAAVDPRTGVLHAYAKALTIDPGSWDVLPDLRPSLEGRLAPFAQDQWYVPADSIRRGAVASSARPAFVIAPRYVGEGRTELLPLSRAQALQTLVENAFNFRLFDGRMALTVLADLVRGAECYRLMVAELPEACDLVLELVEASGEGGTE